MLPTAIVLGIDTPIGLTVVRELGAHGVPVHGIGRSRAALGRASRYCTTFSLRPTGGDLDQWLPAVIEETGAAALLAVSENDLLALARLPEVVAGCRILTPRAAQLDIVLDKQRTLAIAAELGLSVPESWLPAHADDFAANAAALSYPVVLKWSDPMQVMPYLEAAGIAFQKAEFASEVRELTAILKRYAPLGVWPLVQSYCPGNGLGQMLQMAGGHATLRFQHRRLHEWPPEGGVSTLCQAVPLEHHAMQMALSEELLVAIGWEGPAMVEYRFDRARDRYWLMEINGRFWGSLPLAWHCGAHFAWESYRRSVLADTGASPAPRSHLRARYMIPETRRLLRILGPRSAIADPFFVRKPMRDLVLYFVEFFDWRARYYVFSWRDPAPFFADLLSVIRKALRPGTR